MNNSRTISISTDRKFENGVFIEDDRVSERSNPLEPWTLTGRYPTISNALSQSNTDIDVPAFSGHTSIAGSVISSVASATCRYSHIAGVASLALVSLPAGGASSTPVPVSVPSTSPSRRNRIYAIVGDQISDHAKLGATCFRNAIAEEAEPTSIWTDGDEVVFEWLTDMVHAVVTIEDTKHLQYAMRLDGRFVPGSEIEASVTSVPMDLQKYISGK